MTYAELYREVAALVGSGTTFSVGVSTMYHSFSDRAITDWSIYLAEGDDGGAVNVTGDTPEVALVLLRDRLGIAECLTVDAVSAAVGSAEVSL